MLAPLLLYIFLAVVISVASTRFKADKDIIDNLVHRGNKTGEGEVRGSDRRKGSSSHLAVAHA